jgi:hypothetical protein
MRTAIMAITTSNSISVNPRRTWDENRFMECSSNLGVRNDDALDTGLGMIRDEANKSPLGLRKSPLF